MRIPVGGDITRYKHGSHTRQALITIQCGLMGSRADGYRSILYYSSHSPFKRAVALILKCSCYDYISLLILSFWLSRCCPIRCASLHACGTTFYQSHRENCFIVLFLKSSCELNIIREVLV